MKVTEALANSLDPSNTAVGLGSGDTKDEKSSKSLMTDRESRLIPTPSSSPSQSPVLPTTVPKAPLVDSALLRFISAQKIGSEEMDLGMTSLSVEESVVSKAAADRPVTSSNETKDTRMQRPTAGTVENMYRGLKNSSSIAIETQGRVGRDLRARDLQSWPLDATVTAEVNVREEDVTSSFAAPFPFVLPALDDAAARWLHHYDAESVSQKLALIGAESDASVEAGFAVQRHALNRAMRRRIQAFMRERDVMWTNVAESPSVYSAQNVSCKPMAEDAAAMNLIQKFNGVDAVIDVLTGAGLTGKDIAAILTHTPSVATMSARRNETTTVEGSDPESLSRVTTLNETLDNSPCRENCLTALFLPSEIR